MWFYSPQVIRLFLLSVLFGAGAGAFYDLFRILRIARKPRGEEWSKRRFLRYGDFILCFLGDMIFWIVLAVAYSIFIYAIANGRLRISSLIAAAIGFAAWFFSAGRLTVFLADRIIFGARFVLRFVARLTVIPAARIAYAAWSAVSGFIRKRIAIVVDRRTARRENSLAGKGYGL